MRTDDGRTHPPTPETTQPDAPAAVLWNIPIVLRPNHLKASRDIHGHNTPNCGIMRIHKER